MNMWASVLWEDVIHPSLYSLLGLKDLTNLKLEEGHLWKGSGCCSCLHLWTSPPDVYLQFAYRGAHPLDLTGS